MYDACVTMINYSIQYTIYNAYEYIRQKCFMSDTYIFVIAVPMFLFTK